MIPTPKISLPLPAPLLPSPALFIPIPCPPPPPPPPYPSIPAALFTLQSAQFFYPACIALSMYDNHSFKKVRQFFPHHFYDNAPLTLMENYFMCPLSNIFQQ